MTLRACARRAGLPLVLAAALLPPAAFAQEPPAPSPTSRQLPASRCDREGLATVFTCTWHDVRQLLHPQPLVTIGAGGGLSAGSTLADDDVLRAMRGAELDALEPGATLGGPWVQLGGPFVLYAIGRAAGRPEVAGFSVMLLRAQVVNGILTRSLKLAPRARPTQQTAHRGDGSFPSGHTSAAFATATVIRRRWGWKAGLPAYILAGYIGVSRLQGAHYLSDVTFGAALGIASGLAVGREPARGVTISPMAGAGVAGILVAIDNPH